MQGITCTSCRAISRSRFHLRLFVLKDSRRRLHTSPAKLENTPFKPKSWYWETEPPAAENLAAAARFFEAHRPFREWTGTAWRRHKVLTPGGLLVPEIIFLGRSNVGKSSLLNHVTFHDDLNRVSQTPGATKTMWAWSLAARNRDNGGALPGWGGDCRPKLTVVDLPGYGYGSDAEWGNEIITYMKNRRELRRAYVIVDALQGITQHDRKILDVLRTLTIPYQMIVSKCDKSGWRGSQTAVESALSPIRAEAELGSSKHAGLGELILVGGLQSGSSITPYGVENLQWSILRATGLDKYAMSAGPGHAASSASKYNAGTISDTLAASRGHRVFSLKPPEESANQASSRPQNPELSLQDFLAELLNVKKPTNPLQQGVGPLRSPAGSDSTRSPLLPADLVSRRSPSARSNTQNPVDQKLMGLFAASRSQSQEPSPVRLTRSTARVLPAIGKGTLRGADALSAMSGGARPSRSTSARPKSTPPAAPSPPSNRPAPLPGKGVSRGLEAFESMFEAEAPASKKKRGSKGSKAAAPLPSQQPAAPVFVGKGVTQGLDAFESMFSAGESKQSGGKKKRRRH